MHVYMSASHVTLKIFSLDSECLGFFPHVLKCSAVVNLSVFFFF